MSVCPVKALNSKCFDLEHSFSVCIAEGEGNKARLYIRFVGGPPSIERQSCCWFFLFLFLTENTTLDVDENAWECWWWLAALWFTSVSNVYVDDGSDDDDDDDDDYHYYYCYHF